MKVIKEEEYLNSGIVFRYLLLRVNSKNKKMCIIIYIKKWFLKYGRDGGCAWFSLFFFLFVCDCERIEAKFWVFFLAFLSLSFS